MRLKIYFQAHFFVKVCKLSHRRVTDYEEILQNMRVIVQRCSRAEVRIEGEVVGAIRRGFMLLVGITDGDMRAQADLLAKKVAQMRVFEDADGKMNLGLKEVGGAILSISQFTL